MTVEPIDLRSSILSAWRTSARATDLLVASLSTAVWDATVPGIPRRTVRRIAAHLHNSRSRWLRTLGREHGIAVPPLVNLQQVSKKQLRTALKESSAGMEALLRLGLDAGGTVPPSRSYVWRNLPLDVGHVLAYFVAHEGHHRGQLVMIARQLGQRLPAEIVNGLWQWNRRS